jgi:hypothetical protein
VPRHQLSGEPKMRFVSTALVMMAIALMLLALMLLTPTVRANPMIFVANFAGANESAPAVLGRVNALEPRALILASMVFSAGGDAVRKSPERPAPNPHAVVC